MARSGASQCQRGLAKPSVMYSSRCEVKPAPLAHVDVHHAIENGCHGQELKLNEVECFQRTLAVRMIAV
jgi:hypothetical protein